MSSLNFPRTVKIRDVKTMPLTNAVYYNEYKLRQDEDIFTKDTEIILIIDVVTN